MIRGKGSVKEGKVGRKDGQMLPGEDEPLHALVTANTMENVKKAVEQVKDTEGQATKHCVILPISCIGGCFGSFLHAPWKDHGKGPVIQS